MPIPNVPDAREVLDADDLSLFGQLVERRVVLKAQIRAIEAEVDELNNLLTTQLCENDLAAGVRHGNYRVMIVTKQRETLSKERLLSNGVPPAIIKMSTVISESSSLDVRELKLV